MMTTLANQYRNHHGMTRDTNLTRSSNSMSMSLSISDQPRRRDEELASFNTAVTSSFPVFSYSSYFSQSTHFSSSIPSFPNALGYFNITENQRAKYPLLEYKRAKAHLKLSDSMLYSSRGAPNLQWICCHLMKHPKPFDLVIQRPRVLFHP